MSNIRKRSAYIKACLIVTNVIERSGILERSKEYSRKFNPINIYIERR